VNDEIDGISRWEYTLCVIAMIVFGFFVAHEETNPVLGWVFFAVFLCFPTALRGENLGFSRKSFLALFVPGLNIAFALACLSFPEDFATTKKLDVSSIAWMTILTVIAFFWGLLWYQQWLASQPLLQ
jgi:hypothetical protein